MATASELRCAFLGCANTTRVPRSPSATTGPFCLAHTRPMTQVCWGYNEGGFICRQPAVGVSCRGYTACADHLGC